MEFEEAVRTRRTHKAYRPEPVDRATLEALFDLARWAPNHNLTNPWRFRVVGPQTLERLKQAADVLEPGSARKLERAPTLVVSTVKLSGDPLQDREDLLAGAVATYLVLLGAHDRGLAGYWRTPGVLRDPAGLAAVAIPADECVLGLLYLGRPTQFKAPPQRRTVPEIVRYLP
jgi:nitroreductase